MTKYAILDCDGGSDDAWALFLLLRTEGFFCGIKLLAVTITGGGNTTREHAARNMHRVLCAVDRKDVPIYLGAVEAFLPNSRDEKCFHGEDGFGDVFDDDTGVAETGDFFQTDHAVTVIRNLCKQYAQNVTVFVVGPLTNLALCYSMYGNDIIDNVKDIFIMGGNYQGVGNMSRAAEFNFFCDPEAALAVLEKSKCPITVLPWEPCSEERFSIALSWRLDHIGTKALTGPARAYIELMNSVEAAQYKTFNARSWNPCDALIVGVCLFGDKFVLKSSQWHATVDLQGKHTRGQMVLDHLRRTFPENVRIIEQLNVEYFMSAIEWTVGLRETME